MTITTASTFRASPARAVQRCLVAGLAAAGVLITCLPLGAAPASSAQKRVVIVTGEDISMHKWRETAPLLRGILDGDRRLDVRVVEDPAFLASPALARYDVVVLHMMVEKPDPAARENLSRVIAGGAGLVMIHFACGSFRDWEDFVKLAGRIYDPKKPPHDAYGPFRVDIRAPRHEVTSAMQAFETVDELYTCLSGETPIEVLATARSKVTQQDEPMALALGYGKGRVFQTTLGHDVRAYSAPGVKELIRRGAAWAAGLEPEKDTPR